MSRTYLLHASRTIKPFQRAATRRFASTKSPAIRRPVYFGSDVYWGKAWKDVAGTGLLYFPIVAAVMFWPAPVAPLMNRTKGIKKEKVDA